MKWKHSALTKSTQAVTSRETKATELLAESSAGNRRRILWIDGVGGFLLVDRDEVVVGQAVPGSPVDVAIVGDLSRQAAALRRSAGDYLLQPLQATQLGGRSVDRPQLLRDGDQIQFGGSVKLRFSKPSPLSASARLDLASFHRFKPSVDAVLLLADSCILGPSRGSHVVCPGWTSELLLVRQADAWHFRTTQELDANGRKMTGQIPMVAGMRLRGEEFSLSIE